MNAARRANNSTGQLINRLVNESVAAHGWDTSDIVRSVPLSCPNRLRADPTLPLAIRLVMSAARTRRAGL